MNTWKYPGLRENDLGVFVFINLFMGSELPMLTRTSVVD